MAHPLVPVLLSLGLVVSGCALSDSSASISDSITSSSDWSRSSSESSSRSSDGDDGGKTEQPETREEARTYEQDIAQLAYTYAQQGGEMGALRGGVASLAAKRGISNWEADSLTTRSIGKGVGQAGISEEELTSFSDQLFGDDPTKHEDLRDGYREGQLSGETSTSSQGHGQGG